MDKGRVLEGVVISDKMNKTITVEVVRKSAHPFYGKLAIHRKKYKAHNPQNQAKLGDRVRIIECRPLSREKRFRLLEIIK